MATKQTPEEVAAAAAGTGVPVVLTPELIAAIVAAAVKEANKPYVDPVAEAAKELSREELREQERQRIANKKLTIAGCSHKRYDQSWNLGAQRNSDGVVRIVCGQCFGVFEPGHPKYVELAQALNWDSVGMARQS